MSRQDEQPKPSELNNAEKIVLLLLATQNEQAVPGNLWLQKQIFLIAEELPALAEYLDYEPHLQGPFSETVNNIADNLQYLGLVKRSRRGLELTESGSNSAKRIMSGSDAELISQIQSAKNLLNDLSKDEMLVYIYYTFPQMTTSSWEKEDLQEKRVSAAKSLYLRNKVDLEKAADLAGVSRSKFESKIDG